MKRKGDIKKSPEAEVGWGYRLERKSGRGKYQDKF